MANSSTVASGDQMTATQYNNLRKDVIDLTTGHRHDESDSRKLSTLDTSTGHTHNGTDSRIAAPPYYEDIASSDTTMTNANQYYTAVQRSLGAGTWLVIGSAGFDFTSCSLVLYDGTNVLANASTGTSAGYDHLTVHAIVVLGSTTTVALRGACTSAGKKMLAIPQYNGSSAAKQTRMLCLRIA